MQREISTKRISEIRIGETGANTIEDIRWQKVSPGEYVVGRDPSSDIFIADERVSRRHCIIEITKESRVYVTDLKSTNGTYFLVRRLNHSIEGQIERNKRTELPQNYVIKVFRSLLNPR